MEEVSHGSTIVDLKFSLYIENVAVQENNTQHLIKYYNIQFYLIMIICQGGDVGTQYRSGIYYYNESQARLAQESLEQKQKEIMDKKIVTEILPAKTFYRAEEYHQQYLEKGGGRGLKQCAAKGCNDPIRCYG